eukprot:6543162-Prymnesium_polylepis.1
MARAEGAIKSIACAVGSLFAYCAGVTAEHTKLVVVAAEKPASEALIVKDPKERDRMRGAGITALWCTLAALGTGSTLTTAEAIARLAMVSTSQFRPYEPQVAQNFREEAALRKTTGLRPGRTGVMGPVRATLTSDGAVTPRQLIPRAQQGLIDLRKALTEGTGPFAARLAAAPTASGRARRPSGCRAAPRRRTAQRGAVCTAPPRLRATVAASAAAAALGQQGGL